MLHRVGVARRAAWPRAAWCVRFRCLRATGVAAWLDSATAFPICPPPTAGSRRGRGRRRRRRAPTASAARGEQAGAAAEAEAEGPVEAAGRRRRGGDAPGRDDGAAEVLHPVDATGGIGGDADADRPERWIVEVHAMALGADPGRHHGGRRGLPVGDVLAPGRVRGVAAVERARVRVARDRRRIVMSEDAGLRHEARLPGRGVRERGVDRQQREAERCPARILEIDDLLGQRRVRSRPGGVRRAGGRRAERSRLAQHGHRGRQDSRRDRCDDEDAYARHAPPVCGQR